MDGKRDRVLYGVMGCKEDRGCSKLNILKICVFIIASSLIFPFFAYGFTTYSTSEPTSYDLSVQYDDLVSANIIFDEGATHKVTYPGYAEYPFTNSRDVRCYWQGYLNSEYGQSDWFEFRVQNVFGNILDTWGPLQYYTARCLLPYSGVVDRYFQNETIVNNFDDEYNWTRFNLITTGYVALVQPAYAADSIEDAVYTRGELNVTIVKSMETDTDFKPAQFVGWYGNILLGRSAFGLPPFFQWFIRVYTFIGVLSAVLLFTELRKL